MENAKEETRYNGWTNYETWAVGLWLDNDQGSYRYWREVAEECRTNASKSEQVQRGIWTDDEAVGFILADRLKSEVTEASPLTEASMYTDLLSAALAEVDWQEIADHWLSE